MINQLIIDDVPRNYLLISSDMHQRYINTIDTISKSLNLSKEHILENPDIKYVSLPIIDKNGKYTNCISNNDLLLNHYGLIDKIDSNRIGSEISIDQIRDVISFTQISAHKNKKIVILNDGAKLNKEASSALLKTLEEVSSNCTFILICNSPTDIYETIRSRCQMINLDVSKNSKKYNNFEDYFYSNNKFLKDYSEIYNINNLLKDTSSEIESLLSKSADPIEISLKWHKTGIKLIIEVLTNYIVFIVRNAISLDINENNHNNNLKKLSNIYNKIPFIRKNLSLNINQKYILNNISIELAS
tara:strand:+ start:6551 stop:7453 length:903 start_codon:yes stop_codon:yes gene_type:complete